MTLLPDYASIIEAIDFRDKPALHSYVRPGMYALLESAADEFPMGASRFSGRPDLPPGLTWPKCEAGSIPFLAQVNLGELPASASRDLLPPTGMLYFFYGNPEEGLHFPDEPESGGAGVRYADEIGHLTRVDFPDDIDPEYGTFGQPQLLAFHPYHTFVDWEHPVWRRHGSEYGLDMPDVDPAWGDERIKCQMLGHPWLMQSSICYSIQETPFQDEDDGPNDTFIDWALNLETLFAAVDAVGDCSVYFMINRDDLVARRWEKFHLAVQCT